MVTSHGFDPAPPGEYKLTKALVDTDLDGITGAAILKNVYPDIQVHFGEAAEMLTGEHAKLVDAETAIVDLRYLAGCGLYFDHHEDNRPQGEEFPGRWEDRGSAASVVYHYFKDVADLSRFAEMLPELDKFDSGKISREEFLNPNNVVKLGMAINRRDHDFNQHIVELLAEKTIDQVVEDERVKARIERMMQAEEEIFAHIRSNTTVKNGFAVIDMTDYHGEQKINGFFLTSQVPDVDAVLVFKPEHKTGGVKVRLYRNEFNADARSLNLLKLAKRMDPKAGGHKSACGFSLESEAEKPQIVEKLYQVLAEEYPSV